MVLCDSAVDTFAPSCPDKIPDYFPGTGVVFECPVAANDIHVRHNVHRRRHRHHHRMSGNARENSLRNRKRVKDDIYKRYKITKLWKYF